ncbi:MAG: hypothetical protein Q4Q18_02835 [Methanobrevibacter sp.]|nr:hypothetical protein [Methanobrevibacter sp.]
MTEKEIFFKDKENCEIPFTHIEEGNVNPALTYIDELYGAADVLSIKNAIKNEKNLGYLSILGTFVAMLFLLYDEAELHLLIFGCIFIIVAIFLINRHAKNNECHRKYTQYRVLAESLRVQYFILHAGIERNVSDILPWFTKKGIPWVNEVLSELPLKTNGEHKIAHCWIRHQRNYHQKKFHESKENEEIYKRETKRILIITLITYGIALVFEIWILNVPSGEINFDFLGGILDSLQSVGVMVGYSQTDMIRSILKIVLGTMSAATLFAGNYYGKMSLSNISEDHRRMMMLYESALREIKANNGVETEKMIMNLAREFLIENSTWYAYQKPNVPDLTIE